MHIHIWLLPGEVPPRIAVVHHPTRTPLVIEHMASSPKPKSLKTEDSEEDVKYTVFIRLPFSRGDFVDPPPVCKTARSLIRSVET